MVEVSSIRVPVASKVMREGVEVKEERTSGTAYLAAMSADLDFEEDFTIPPPEGRKEGKGCCVSLGALSWRSVGWV